MRRIRSAYEARFRKLLEGVHARNPEKALQWFHERATKLSRDETIPAPTALNRVYEDALRKNKHWFNRKLRAPVSDSDAPPTFWCDAGLGGLARWLRAAGYEAQWKYGIDDEELVREAQGIGAILLTTDSGMMDRRLLRDGIVKALWLSPTLKIPDQLTIVFQELHLQRRASRCMSCGGELRRVDKESLRSRIPPRTYLWIDEYFLCDRCGQLFWHGTHWRKIKVQLDELAGELWRQTA